MTRHHEQGPQLSSLSGVAGNRHIGSPTGLGGFSSGSSTAASLNGLSNGQLRTSAHATPSNGLSRHSYPVSLNTPLQHRTQQDSEGVYSTEEPRSSSKMATNLSRSRSFGGMLHRSGGSQNPLSPTSPTGTPVLGEAYRGHSPSAAAAGSHSLSGSSTLTKRHTFANRKSPRLPKVPRPERVGVIFESVKKGLREWIRATDDDIGKLHTMEDLANSSSSAAAQAKLHEIEKQVKQAERFKTRLEFQLAKIEELEDDYKLQQQLRNGVRTMAKAYVSSTGTHQKTSLINVKCGFKECTQTMCAIEAELENMLGAFHCKLRGLAGFARLTPGDVFQVIVNHGTQKWKSKGRISTKAQKWDNDYTTIKALVGEVLNIRALEVKGFGMSVDLGQKSCETRELFCASPQIMTVSINANGSLKLSIVISWNPLEGNNDGMAFYEPALHKSPTTMYLAPVSPLLGPQRLPYVGPGGAVKRSKTSPEHMNQVRQNNANHRISVPPDLEYYNPKTQSHSALHTDHHNVMSLGCSVSSATTSSYPSTLSNQSAALALSNQSAALTLSNQNASDRLRPHSVAIAGSTADSLASSGDLSSNKNRLFDMRLLAESINGGTQAANNTGADGYDPDLRSSPYKSAHADLEQIVDQLRYTLEDYQGQYVELANLEQQVQLLHNMLLHSGGAVGSRSSDVSISVETALGAFDFLESEDYLDSAPARPSATPRSRHRSLSPSVSRNRRRSSEGSSSSANHLTTGDSQVDQALVWHLVYCDRLLENLGRFGPLKCREIYSLDKLNRQADIVENLLHVTTDYHHDMQKLMHRLTTKNEICQFWSRCIDGYQLSVDIATVMAQLERSYGDIVRDQYNVTASKVFHALVARVLDIPFLETDTPNFTTPNLATPFITMHQLLMYFSEQKPDLLAYVQQIAREVWLSSRLRSGDTDLVIKTLLGFRDTLPPTECLRVTALLLIAQNKEVHTAAENYLRAIERRPLLRQKAMVVYVEGLEDRNADVRCAACIALQILRAVESLDQLVYICHTDSSQVVKSHAKEALLSFGELGRRAFDESQRSSHGFQGIHISNNHLI